MSISTSVLKINTDCLEKGFVSGLITVKDIFNLSFTIDGIKIIAVQGERFCIDYSLETLTITYTRRNEFFRGIMIFYAQNKQNDFHYEQNSYLDSLAIMVDNSRNAVLTLESVKLLLGYMAAFGYNQLQLYLEDTYEIENEPYFGYGRGRYTVNELKEIDDYADMLGIEVVPCIQTLAHFNAITRWRTYSEFIDTQDILLVDDPKTYQLIEKIFLAMRKCFRSSKINIGMDEAHMIGSGKFLDRHGYENRSKIMQRHLEHVVELAKKYDYQPMMWSDMFFKLATGGYYNEGDVPKEIRDKIPPEISLVYWQYYRTDQEIYDTMIQKHLKFDNKTIFAGGVLSWMGFCPFNQISLKTAQASLDSCFENGIKDVIVTVWGDNGAECPVFSLLPALFFTAEKSYGNQDMKLINQRFQSLIGISLKDFMTLDLPNLISNNPDDLINPCKYLLYNDPFIGLLDSTIKKGLSSLYKDYSKKLADIKNEKFDYLFKTAKSLCDVLELKAELGVLTRKAYKENNKEMLQSLLDDRYYPLLQKLEVFYQDFKKQWMKFNKPHGFDVQDIRLGGLKQRVISCADRLKGYIQGDIKKIDELEEEILDYHEGYKPKDSGCRLNNYILNATANVL